MKKGRRRAPAKKKARRPYSPKIEEVRSFVGKRLFGAYRKAFGVSRAYSVGAILKKNVKEKTISSLSKKKEKRQARFLEIKKARPKFTVSFHPSKKRGYLREYVRGRPTRKLVKIADARGIKKREARQRRVDALSVGLGLDAKQTRGLLASVEKAAADDLRKFKKSKRFKALAKRDRRKFNLRRERSKYLDLLMDMVDEDSP